MKKTGIITMFYNSINYGGVLQAYALQKATESLGLESEQICYVWKQGDLKKGAVGIANRRITLKKIVRKAFGCVRRIHERFAYKNQKQYMNKLVEERKKAFADFNSKYVGMSSGVFNCENIHNANRDYDVFITGSDQVWGGYSIDRGYSLDFADDTKKKIAYSVSGLASELTSGEKAYYQRIMSGFSGISVRENKSVELLQPLCDIDIEYTLDPTLLLTKDDWDEVCSDYSIKDDYVFCYFLGSSRKQRKTAIEFAKKNNLKTVFITGIRLQNIKWDSSHCDYHLDNVSPADFVALIKNAEYVFTDSFHACVFSGIYKKQFFVFKRDDCGGFERILNITELYDARHRIVDSCNHGDIFDLKPIEYADTDKIDEMRCKSLKFIVECIGK